MANERHAFNMLNTPAGSSVASKIPWWRSATQRIFHSGMKYPDQFTFTGQHSNQRFIRNEFAWPLYITEVRMWSVPHVFNGARYSNTMEQLAIKMFSDQIGYINSKWVPASTFNTEEDRHLFGQLNGMVYTLPADFYLNHSNHIGVSLRMDETLDSDDYVSNYQVAMRGYDPTNNSPIVVSHPIDALVADKEVMFMLDDDRDRNVRNMWVRDFTFARLNHRNHDKEARIWSRLFARFDVPEGPHWTMDPQTPLMGLADQVPYENQGDINAADVIYQDQPMIHRPITPYVLYPGQGMRFETQLQSTFWNFTDAETDDDVDIWIHVRGYQEGSRA